MNLKASAAGGKKKGRDRLTANLNQNPHRGESWHSGFFILATSPKRSTANFCVRRKRPRVNIGVPPCQTRVHFQVRRLVRQDRTLNLLAAGAMILGLFWLA